MKAKEKGIEGELLRKERARSRKMREGLGWIGRMRGRQSGRRDLGEKDGN